MTIVSSGDARIIEQVTKQLNKLIDVIKSSTSAASISSSANSSSSKYEPSRSSARRSCASPISSVVTSSM